MYENLNQYSLKRSTFLIRFGLALLAVNVILGFIFPSESFSISANSNDEIYPTFQNFPSILVTAVKMFSNLVGFTSLIAGIVILVQDKRKGIESHFSVPNRIVDLTQQTKFAFIPGLDLYACYKVKKLRTYILIISGIVIPAIILVSMMPNFAFNYMVAEGIVLPIAVYLIRKWSKKWNEQFSENKINDF